MEGKEGDVGMERAWVPASGDVSPTLNVLGEGGEPS